MGRSNLAFKQVQSILHTAGKTGTNWISLPLINSYGNARDLCTDIPNSTSISRYNAVSDTTQTWTCGNVGTPFSLPKGEALSVKCSVASSGVFVGMHDPTFAYTFVLFDPVNGGGTFNYFSLPYNAKGYATFSDLMADIPNCIAVGKYDEPTDVTEKYYVPSIADGQTVLVTYFSDDFGGLVVDEAVTLTGYGAVTLAQGQVEYIQSITNQSHTKSYFEGVDYETYSDPTTLTMSVQRLNPAGATRITSGQTVLVSYSLLPGNGGTHYTDEAVTLTGFANSNLAHRASGVDISTIVITDQAHSVTYTDFIDYNVSCDGVSTARIKRKSYALIGNANSFNLSIVIGDGLFAVVSDSSSWTPQVYS